MSLYRVYLAAASTAYKTHTGCPHDGVIARFAVCLSLSALICPIARTRGGGGRRRLPASRFGGVEHTISRSRRARSKPVPCRRPEPGFGARRHKRDVFRTCAASWPLRRYLLEARNVAPRPSAPSTAPHRLPIPGPAPAIAALPGNTALSATASQCPRQRPTPTARRAALPCLRPRPRIGCPRPHRRARVDRRPVPDARPGVTSPRPTRAPSAARGRRRSRFAGRPPRHAVRRRRKVRRRGGTGELGRAFRTSPRREPHRARRPRRRRCAAPIRQPSVAAE